MKILFIATGDPSQAGDYQENTLLHGLRTVLRDDFVEYPRKAPFYGEFEKCGGKQNIHGWGFSMFSRAIPDVPQEKRQIALEEECDFLIYGVTPGTYGVPEYPELEKLAKYGVIYVDGHDHMEISRTPCFKREWCKEYVNGKSNVWPIGFGIPDHLIRPLDIERKSQLIQSTAPPYSLFGPQVLGIQARTLYRFDQEEDYYDDMADSWFGLTSIKGGWDQLRVYEIMAAGSVLLYRDYDKKPEGCSPDRVPTISYSSRSELESIMNALVVNNKPTDKYFELFNKQRTWLLENGTTKARAYQVLSKLNEIRDYENVEK